MSKRVKLAAGAVAVLLSAAIPAAAQTAGGTLLNQNTGPITDGAWSVTLSGCVVTPAGGSAAACNGTDEVIPTISGNSLSLVFEAANGGALETAGPGLISDLSFTTITATYTGASINASFVNVSGTGDGANGSHLTVNEGTVNGSVTGAITNLANSPTLQTVTFAAVATSTASGINIKTNATGLSSGLTMNTATVGFTTVPEPVSASLFAVGVAGLGFARRKRRQLK